MKYNYNIKSIILIIFIIIAIIIFNLITKNNVIEGLTNPKSKPWSQDLIDRFILFEQTTNDNNYQFDMNMVQRQASPEEAEELLKTGKWPWSSQTKYLFMENIWKNPIIKINPGIALDDAMTIYNETAMKELLGWNAKEGKFILYGGDLGVTEGMPEHVRNTIKCTSDRKGGYNVEKKVFKGYNTWNGFKNVDTTIIKNEDIPKEMPGFQFIKNPCNPCVPLNMPPDYSCPFTLNIKGDNETSQIWKDFWGLK